MARVVLEMRPSVALKVEPMLNLEMGSRADLEMGPRVAPPGVQMGAWGPRGRGAVR